jgi:hypothetical protein
MNVMRDIVCSIKDDVECEAGKLMEEKCINGEHEYI